jgi:hypothetical protein
MRIIRQNQQKYRMVGDFRANENYHSTFRKNMEKCKGG